MKRIFTSLIALVITGIVAGQQGVTAVHLPQVMSVDETKMPFVCRLTLTGLNPNATYRYYNRFATAASSPTSNGDGNYILVKSATDFVRVTAPSLSAAGRYGEFTTDAAGSFTGWFAGEPSNATAFDPGSEVFVRIVLNNGAGGGSPATRVTTTASVRVLNFGAATGEGTAIRSTPAAEGVARNFVFLYDDATAGARPVAGTFIESDGSDNSTANGYADFYAGQVNMVAKTWGAIIPNNLTNGIRKIVHYAVADGSEVGGKTSSDGTWAKEGGGRVPTLNTTGGLTDVIVLNGNVVTLGIPVKLDQTITFNPLTAVTYGAADLQPGATANSLLPVTYSSSNAAVATIVNGNTIHIVGAGTADITAIQNGDDDYNAATPVVQSLTVARAPLTIQADNKQKVQGDPLPVLTASYTGFVPGDDANSLTPQPTLSTTATATSDAGDYPITAGGAGSLNYDISYQAGVLTVTSSKQPQTISFAPLSPHTYGDMPIDAGATASSGLPVTYSTDNPAVAIIENSRIRITGTGTVTITASQAGSGNFEPAADVTQQLVINKAPLTIRADNKTKLEGHANPALTITYSGFVYSESNTILTAQPVTSTTAVTGSPVGDYPITVTGATADNYTITHTNGTLAITPLPAQSITFHSLAVKKYGDPGFKLDAAASSGLTVNYRSSNPGVARVSNDSLYITGTGTTLITAAQPGDAFNAPAADVTQTLTVQKVLLTIRADNKTKNENQPNPALTVQYSGFVNNENTNNLSTLPVVATTATASSLVGTYPITVTGAAAANYNMLQLGGILTVQPVQGSDQNAISAYCSSPGQLQVNIHVDTTQKAVVQLFDPYGARLLHVNVSLGKGSNSFRFPIGNVVPGIYYVRVSGKEFLLKEKVSIR